MTLLVDTSVWSLVLRRDAPRAEPEAQHLADALKGAEVVVFTGLVLQELLQGFSGPKSREQVLERFGSLPLLQPDRADYIGAAEIRNNCRRSGVQLGTVDALIAQLSIRYKLTLLSTDNDFKLAARHCPLRLWKPKLNIH